MQSLYLFHADHVSFFFFSLQEKAALEQKIKYEKKLVIDLMEPQVITSN